MNLIKKPILFKLVTLSKFSIGSHSIEFIYFREYISNCLKKLQLNTPLMQPNILFY